MAWIVVFCVINGSSWSLISYLIIQIWITSHNRIISSTDIWWTNNHWMIKRITAVFLEIEVQGLFVNVVFVDEILYLIIHYCRIESAVGSVAWAWIIRYPQIRIINLIQLSLFDLSVFDHAEVALAGVVGFWAEERTLIIHSLSTIRNNIILAHLDVLRHAVVEADGALLMIHSRILKIIYIWLYRCHDRNRITFTCIIFIWIFLLDIA